MSISHKNLLQEFCQKNLLDLPKYITKSETSTEWYSTVTIFGKTYHSKNPTTRKIDAEQLVARKAHRSARKRLERQKKKETTNLDTKSDSDPESDEKTVLTTPPERKINKRIQTGPIQLPQEAILYTDVSNIDTIYMLDLENKPYFNYTAKSNMLFIGFITSIHHSILNYHQKSWLTPSTDDIYNEVVCNENNMLIYDIDGGVADLADHYMTMFIYRLVDFIIRLNKPCTIYIVSGDHAAYCTKICLEKALKWSKNEVCLTSEVKNTIIPPK